jgi:hypothetical protein
MVVATGTSFTNKQLAEYAFDLQVGLEGADVPEYESAITIGKAAVLAVNLRGLGELDYKALRLVAARYFHIRSDVLDGVLRTLADLELVKLVTTDGSIEQVIPTVPHFENIYERVGELTAAKPLNELEQLTIAMLDQLYRSPINRDSLHAKLGADHDAFCTSLQIGVEAGLMIDQRARGRNIIASPLYFSGNLDGLIDVAARGDTPNVRRVLSLVARNQGMPLSVISKECRIADAAISAEDVVLLQGMAEQSIIKPPAIERPNNAQERFIFTPAPGRTRMSAANREIYEKGMALAAAVRKGQLLPEAYRIISPQALLYRLGDRKWINANTEAAHQYKNLAVLGLGRLEHTGGGFYRFHLIDVPENLEAVGIAKTLLAGERPPDLELDNQARLLLSHDESYVKSHLSSASLRKPAAKKTILSQKAHEEIDQYILAL